MDDDIVQSAYLTVIEDLKAKIAAKEAELLPMKRLLNGLCEQQGLEPPYNLDDPTAQNTNPLKFAIDAFFNKPLATCVTLYLDARHEAKMEKPASADEIYEALIAGGYKFEGSSADNNKRALKTALTKNTAQFVKIGDLFGLRKWYGMRASRKGQANGATNGADDVVDDQAPAEEAAAGEPDIFAAPEEGEKSEAGKLDI